jgi:polysaccharide biosynthesis/export protein
MVRRIGALWSAAVGVKAPIIAFVALVMVANATSATAQTLDPKVLQQVQSQLGASGATANSPNDLDRTRETPTTGRGDSTMTVGQHVDTSEEQELRRQQSRAALAKLYKPSPVEREYRSRLADPTLRQFGYDLFQATQSGSGGLNGAVDESYIVGIGDDLVVQFQGATNDSKVARVDRDGRLIVGQLPPISAAGRSLGSIRRDLEVATRRTLLGTEVFVSLGQVRSITVFVGGEVERPGQVALTSLSDISAALAQVGGIRRSGSLRNVRIVSGGVTRSVDLYGLLGIGTPPTVRLRDGDRIIVPVIGDTVAVAGSVARPGIYELRGGTSVGQVLDFAGGAVRPRGNSIAISRIAADGTEQFVKSVTLASAVVPGDAVQLVGGSAGGAMGRVVLRGNVMNPGPRPLSAAPTVRDLLGSVNDLQSDTYMPMAILIRRDLATASRVFQPVNLLAALRNAPGVPLRSDDRLYVFSRSDIEFINKTPVREIVLGQRNPQPDCTSLDRLEALVRDTQSARFNVVTRGTFIVERNGQSDVAATGGTAAQAGSRRGEEALRSGDDQIKLTQAQTRDQTGIDATDQSTDSDALLAQRNKRCPAVFEEEPDLLPVLIENAIGVSGAVRQPGAYPIGDTVTAQDIANVAEGILTNARSISLDVIHASNQTAGATHVEVDPACAILSTVYLKPGDDIRFNAALPQFAAGGVLLTGEFARPGLYTIRRGETLSQLIARAGGTTNLAYPYGAIFTRRSVKEAQQEGFRRTGRELSNALLAVSARKDSKGDSIIAASKLIDTLSTVESPGRVVIEADPRVLAIRPDLDSVLESGDVIYMPTRPNFVLALGDVSNPGALQFIAGKNVGDYISETGGTAATSDASRIFLVLPNGTAQPVHNHGRGITVPPGSTIIVPKDIDPLYKLDIARDVSTIVGNLIASVATIALLAK